MLSGDRPEASAQLLFLIGHGTTGQALGRAPLAGDQARSTFGDPETLRQVRRLPSAAEMSRIRSMQLRDLIYIAVDQQRRSQI